MIKLKFYEIWEKDIYSERERRKYCDPISKKEMFEYMFHLPQYIKCNTLQFKDIKCNIDNGIIIFECYKIFCMSHICGITQKLKSYSYSELPEEIQKINSESEEESESEAEEEPESEVEEESESEAEEKSETEYKEVVIDY